MAPIPEQCRDPTTPLKRLHLCNGSNPSMSGRRALFPPVPRADGGWLLTRHNRLDLKGYGIGKFFTAASRPAASRDRDAEERADLKACLETAHN